MWLFVVEVSNWSAALQSSGSHTGKHIVVLLLTVVY